MRFKWIKYITLFSVAAVVVLGLTVETATAQKNESSEKESKKKATVVLKEFGDYQCPACGYFHSMVKKLKEDFDDRLKVQFYHFPLQQHQYAALAARAAEAARNQGKFWAMHNKLYSNQKKWSQGNATKKIFNYAKQIGLDMKQFKKDLNARETQQTVMADKQKGRNLGVNSTPTFILNGKQMKLPRTYKVFKSRVKKALQEQK